MSRKHLTLSVSAIKPGEGVSQGNPWVLRANSYTKQSLIHTRSKVTLEDEKTKFGTEVDGETLLVSITVEEEVNGRKEYIERIVHGGTRVLKNDEHVIKLGKYEHLFR